MRRGRNPGRQRRPELYTLIQELCVRESQLQPRPALPRQTWLVLAAVAVVAPCGLVFAAFDSPGSPNRIFNWGIGLVGLVCDCVILFGLVKWFRRPISEVSVVPQERYNSLPSLRLLLATGGLGVGLGALAAVSGRPSMALYLFSLALIILLLQATLRRTRKLTRPAPKSEDMND